MVKLWARLLLSSFLLSSAVLAQPVALDSNLFPFNKLGNPEYVADWLRQYGTTADKARAQEFFDAGTQATSRKDWGLATKMFGESALRFPGAVTIRECADATTRMLGQARKRKGELAAKRADDLKNVLAYYRAALAADEVTHELNATEKDQLTQDTNCLSAYLATGKTSDPCRPISIYQQP